ncbi:hypothetical protein BGZ70_008988 [Mortierella alpina]|uniref:DUF605-domain-containing protein n=1 Tax=Mortierella alpina TaxID=64518 RepID=A0A9P6M0V3_MORAP|nr:hypothetical protein BGZ70_008988 [Mortierella alpina]
MSVANVPEGLKNITPFLQRAAQLQDREPVVSYYCNANNRAFIEELFGVLEKQKKDIGDNEAISDDLVGYAHIENFALKIFKRADDEDRAGQASQKTAKNFVAAANFLELLKVFGDIDSDVEEKVKYAKWRAADIVKAIRDGRQPQPPPGAAVDEFSASLDMGMSGIESSGDGAASAGSSVFMPPAATPSFPPSDQQPGVPSSAGAPAFPTISNFPSPPLEHMSSSGTVNTFNSADSSNNNNTWSQPPVSPNMSQGGPSAFNSGSAPFHQQQPSSTYIPPSPAAAATNSGYLSSPTNPMSPPTSNSNQYGYGINSTVDNSNLYQPPVVPSPAPAPTPSPYTQPSFNPPSAPYHQPPHQPHQPPPPPPAAETPYTPVAMVLDPAVNSQVVKHCKWTVSALTYDDVPTAIDNLEKALALLRPYHKK